MGVFEEYPPGGLEWWLAPAGKAFFQFGLVDMEGECLFVGIDGDAVAVFHHAYGTALVSFGRDMADNKAVGTS